MGKQHHESQHQQQQSQLDEYEEALINLGITRVTPAVCYVCSKVVLIDSKLFNPDIRYKHNKCTQLLLF